jgi:hypothetical protein
MEGTKTRVSRCILKVVCTTPLLRVFFLLDSDTWVWLKTWAQGPWMAKNKKQCELQFLLNWA